MSRNLTLAATLLLGVSAYGQSDQDHSNTQRWNSDNGAYSSQDREYNRPYDQNRGYGSNQYAPQRNTSNTASTRVRSLNKASNLIGAEVLNRSNEPLGEVKDVVIDFNSGRIAYVVLDASEILGDQDRTLIAVPARALHVNPRQNTLQLDADRNRIQQTRAFTENNYPPIRSQSAQMARWQNQPETRSQFQSSYGPDTSAWNQNRFSQNGNRNRAWQNENAGDDNDAYVYEWYLIPTENGEQADLSGNFDNSRDYRSGGNFDQDQQNSRGAFGQSESGRSWNNSPHSNADENSDFDSRQSSQSFNGRPSSNSGWTEYDRYYRQQRRNQNLNQSQDSSNQVQDQSNSARGSAQGAPSYRSNSGSSSAGNSGNNSQRISGWIREIDPANRTLVVETRNRTVQLQVGNDATIKENGRKNIDLTQLQQGQRVDVGYAYSNGSNRAFTINERAQAGQSTQSSQPSQNSQDSQSGQSQNNQQSQNGSSNSQ